MAADAPAEVCAVPPLPAAGTVVAVMPATPPVAIGLAPVPALLLGVAGVPLAPFVDVVCALAPALVRGVCAWPVSVFAVHWHKLHSDAIGTSVRATLKA
jgi:hypothetical protein